MKDDNPFYFNDAEIHHPFLLESSLSIIISTHRLSYITSNLINIQTALSNKKLKLTLDNTCITVSTTEQTRDPYILIKGRDMLSLIAKCVPFEDARKVLEDFYYFDIINVKPNENRMKRFEGPKAETLHALKCLTKTEIYVERKSVCVIGKDCRRIREVREVVESCFGKNIHPSFMLKKLVVKNTVKDDKEKSGMDWSNYLPMAKSKIKNTRGKKKKKEEGNI